MTPTLIGIAAPSTALASLAELGSLLSRTKRCGAGEHAQAIAAAAKRVLGDRSATIRILIPNGSRGNQEPLARQFKELTGIDIAISEIPVDDINSRILLSTLSTKTDFDIALPATFGLPELVEAKCLLPIDDLAKKHEPKGYLDSHTYTAGDQYLGKRYGYQTDGDTYLTFYNLNLLEDEALRKSFEDQHGYPPGVATTWEELDRLLTHFHAPDQDRYGGLLFRALHYVVWEWWSRFHSQGWLPFSDDLEPLIAEEGGVKALEALLRATDSLHASAKTSGLFDNWREYGRGRALVNLGWGGTQKYLRENTPLRDRLAFGPMPGGLLGEKSLPMPYFNWGWNYVLSAKTPEPELAYLYTLFACAGAPSCDAVAAASGFFDPFREEHYTDPHIVETYSKPFLKAHRASMKGCIPDLYLNGQSEYFEALRLAIERASRGAAAPASALRIAAKEWNEISRRKGFERQRDQWRELKAQYPAKILPHLQAKRT